MPKLPSLGSIGASIKERVGKKSADTPHKKLTVAYIIKTAICVLILLGVMAAFSHLCRELADDYLFLVLPKAGVIVPWLIQLVIFSACLMLAINLVTVLARPVWLTVIAYLLTAAIYTFIMGSDKVMLIIAVVFFAGLLGRLIFVVTQLNNQIKFSVHPLSDKTIVFCSLLAMLVAAAFWFSYSADMARRNFIITPEIKSTVLDLSMAKVNKTIKNQQLKPAQEKALLAAVNPQVQKIFDEIEKPLKPYAKYVPIILAVILFSFLLSVFAVLGLVSLLILKLLLLILRWTRFTNFKTETREIKHLTLESAE